jgi:hypothetical protein
MIFDRPPLSEFEEAPLKTGGSRCTPNCSLPNPSGRCTTCSSSASGWCNACFPPDRRCHAGCSPPPRWEMVPPQSWFGRVLIHPSRPGPAMGSPAAAKRGMACRLPASPVQLCDECGPKSSRAHGSMRCDGHILASGLQPHTPLTTGDIYCSSTGEGSVEPAAAVRRACPYANLVAATGARLSLVGISMAHVTRLATHCTLPN